MYLDGSKKSEAGVEAKDERKQEELWASSVRMVELKEGDTVLEGW